MRGYRSGDLVQLSVDAARGVASVYRVGEVRADGSMRLDPCGDRWPVSVQVSAAYADGGVIQARAEHVCHLRGM